MTADERDTCPGTTCPTPAECNTDYCFRTHERMSWRWSSQTGQILEGSDRALGGAG